MRLAAISLAFICSMPAVAADEPAGLEGIPDSGVTAELDGRAAIFYAIDLEDGRRFAWAPERADERHPPYSTFKIPNLLIALETGAAGSIDDIRRRDPGRRPAQPWWSEAWREDQSLGQAFRRSTVWYFQEVALDVGGRATVSCSRPSTTATRRHRTRTTRSGWSARWRSRRASRRSSSSGWCKGSCR